MSMAVGPLVGADTARVFGVSFLVLATKIIRPGHVYRLSVTNYLPQLVTMHASVFRDSFDVASAEQQCTTGIPETMMLKIPPQALDGVYKLKIEGRTEADEVVFFNETTLNFSHRSITIFVQTDKSIYKQGQVVRFRTVPITTDLKPFPDALDVYMLDPNGIPVRRWLSKQTNLGSVSIEYPLSKQPVLGNWTIRVYAQGQVQDGHFLVEEYYLQQYEVKVDMPSEFLETEEYISGSIFANYTSGAPVTGNLTVVVSAEGSSRSASTTETESNFKGYTEFKYKMKDLRTLLDNRIENARVTVTAYVGERYLDLFQSGFSSTTITSSKIKLKFSGSSVMIFKPYMTFDTYLVASFADGSPLPVDTIKSSLLDIRVTAINKFGSTPMPNRTFEVLSTIPGTWKITIDVRSFINKLTLPDFDYIRIEVTFIHPSVQKVTATARAYPYHAPSMRTLQVTTSTSVARVGDYAVFHAHSNYKIDVLSYLVISKGLILASGRERMKSSPTTFAVPVSAEMVPRSTILLYDVTKNNELVVDALTFHVDGTSQHNFTVILNPNKDKHGETLEVAVYGQPGTYVGLTASNIDLKSISNVGQLDPIEFERKMGDFDDQKEGTSHYWLTADGAIKELLRFPLPVEAVDASGVLESTGLIIFTDATVPARSQNLCAKNFGRCLVIDRCYNETLFKCNGRDDCGDGSDEMYCENVDAVLSSKVQEKLTRFNRFQRIYEDNWLWKDVNIGPLGHYIFNVPLPTTTSSWSISGFAMSSFHGIGLMKKPLEISNVRPFDLKVEMPKSCNLGEQIGIRAIISNFISKNIEITVTLANSPDYKFVHVGESGEVASYNPETSFGEHQHLITLKSSETTFTFIPIVPQRLGDIVVTISAVTQVAKRTVSKLLHVEADGIPQLTHIDIVLDLLQGSYLIRHLDTNITESPVVKYDKVRKYIYGSNKVSLSLSGGVVGSVFPAIPVDTNLSLRLPSDSGEQNMYEFAINLLSISYLRQTGQETPELKKEVFKNLNLLYQKQLSYRNKDGSFRVFRSSMEPSIWLTAFVARYLHQATAQEWENYIYIDPEVIDSAINWIVSKQAPGGSFSEQTFFTHDRKFDSTQRFGYPIEDFKLKNMSLTAYVLISLYNVRDRAGEQAKVNSARIQAQKYLESQLHRTTIKTATDPFSLAIVTYALQLVNSIEGDESYMYLEKQMHQHSGLRYWAPEPVLPNFISTQNNRNIIYPKSRGKFDSRNVQTTAYGLLTLIQRQGRYQKEVVEWLNTQRFSSSGWASTQDTIVALESLIAYSISSDHRSVTDLKISVEAPNLRGINRENKFTIAENNLSRNYIVNIPDAHGIFSVRAEGSGTAILSLDIQYNVDWPHLQLKPAVRSFDLEVKPSYSGRNSSNMHMDICARWTLLAESARSGMAVLEVPVPTGYVINQNVLNRIINVTAGSTLSYPRNLREAKTSERKVYFYFDYIDDKRTCLQFTLSRIYPVANMSRFMPVKIYDYYAPERFNETMLNAYNLYALSVCHVCGSYQCPYCPTFSNALDLKPTTFVMLSILIVSSALNYWAHSTRDINVKF